MRENEQVLPTRNPEPRGRPARRAPPVSESEAAEAPRRCPRPLSGHFWTLAGYLVNRLSRPRMLHADPFELELSDPTMGRVRLSGRLTETGTDRLLIVLHGIAGNCDSGYAVRAAAAAQAAGLSCLRLNARGSDRSGEDLFHAGLTEDLRAVMESPRLAGYRSFHVLGYSLGGHVALRAATQVGSPRLRSVAAICSPLDLSACATAFDRPVCWLYRRRILVQLSRLYARVAARRPLAVAPETVRRVRSLREFDSLTVAPRFGFEDAEDYYRRMSVGPRLERLRVPALLVAGVSDPLVPLETSQPFLRSRPAALTVGYLDPGGHVGFPARASLGLAAPVGIESQAVAWLTGRPAARAL